MAYKQNHPVSSMPSFINVYISPQLCEYAGMNWRIFFSGRWSAAVVPKCPTILHDLFSSRNYLQLDFQVTHCSKSTITTDWHCRNVCWSKTVTWQACAIKPTSNAL